MNSVGINGISRDSLNVFSLYIDLDAEQFMSIILI